LTGFWKDQNWRASAVILSALRSSSSFSLEGNVPFSIQALRSLGIVGLFLPFLQGILFIVMGLSLLSTESPRAKAWMERLQAHLPGHKTKSLTGTTDGGPEHGE
jgi:hypothetical protein